MIAWATPARVSALGADVRRCGMMLFTVSFSFSVDGYLGQLAMVSRPAARSAATACVQRRPRAGTRRAEQLPCRRRSVRRPRCGSPGSRDARALREPDFRAAIGVLRFLT